MVRSNTAEAGKIAIAALILFVLIARASQAADPMVGIHSARVMSQSMPWMAQEAGLFKKYNLDFNLVFISSSSIVTAALLGGDAEMTITGGIGNVAAYARGSTDVVFIGGVKNTKTHTLVAGGNIKRPEDLKGEKNRRQSNRRQLALLHHTGTAPFGHGRE
jgi:ABC-type taurine transport system, periplasmic component